MPQALLCEHCGTRFEPGPAGPPKSPPRCPQCLRRHGVRDDAGATRPVTPAVTRGKGVVGDNLWLFVPVAATLVAVAVWAVRGGGGAGGAEGDGGPRGVEAMAEAAREAQIDAAVKKAAEALESGDLKEAYRQAEEAVQQAPTAAPAREILGDVLSRSGARAEALKEYDAALSIEESGRRHVKAGNLRLADGDGPGAARHLKRGLELEPGADWAAEVRKALEDLGAGVLDGPGGADTLPPHGGGGGPPGAGAGGGGPP